MKFAIRSLARTKGLTLTVVLTLALGIGANAAIFTLVRGVLLRPLVNRDEGRLIYIRQSAQGLGVENSYFSVPEIQDLKQRITTLNAFGDFSTIGFTMVGLGEPREVQAGVVGGSFFSVMGLHPVLGRLLDQRDDGPSAAGAAVLTYRFWSTDLRSDPSVIGRTLRLGTRSATVVGVLEPSIPYPAETEIIANVVTSPHHLSATMVTGRVHRMTELFGRLAPGADLEAARVELRAVHASILKEHPESYSPNADFRIDARLLRDQITSKARTILWVLMAASALIFIIACSNVANLILARTVRREGELAIRAALGAGTWALRRALLVESLLLCGAGALLGVFSARPMVAVLSRYAARYSVRALDLTVDSSMLWVGAGLALAAAVLLAFVPRLPSAESSQGAGMANGGVRSTVGRGTSRRLRLFAVIQVAASFLLLAGAVTLVKTLLALQSAQTGFDTRHVLALNVPPMTFGRSTDQVVASYKEAIRRIGELPGVSGVAVGTVVPWREGESSFSMQFSTEGRLRGANEDDPRARFRTISPGFFATLGVPILAGRDFNDSDSPGSERVVIISQSLAQRMFPNQDAVNRHMMWTDPVLKFIGISADPRRIVGVVADVEDEKITPGPAITVYHPLGQAFAGQRAFVHTRDNPYALVSPVTSILRSMAPDQVVEHAASLEDIRAEVLAPDRLNTIVFGGFAAVALAIAVVGVAGVLAFSVSGRTREFGIRLAIGSEPRQLLMNVLSQGLVMAASGILAGLLCGLALLRVAASYLEHVQHPGATPIAVSALLLLLAALFASVLPALRAARVDIMRALRTD